jgi:hypothetical protein
MLNRDNRFTKGRFKDEHLEDVMDEEPGYLTWLLENCELSYEETAAIEEVLEGGDVF